MILRLQLAACRLALALMLGLLVVAGFVVAPQLFAHAGSRMEAGMLAGHVFHVANSALLLLAMACAAFWFRLQAAGVIIGRWRWLLLLALVLLVVGMQWGVAPQMAQLKAQMPLGIDAVAADDPRRLRFGLLHGISSVFHLLASLLAAVLVALGVERAEGRAS